MSVTEERRGSVKAPRGTRRLRGVWMYCRMRPGWNPALQETPDFACVEGRVTPRRRIYQHALAAGFTLLELMLALGLLAVITVVTFVSFSVVAQAWQRGMSLSEKLQHGDFVVEQLVMALRSTYYPSSGLSAEYGLWLKDDGDGPHAADTLSWVKLGGALVGRHVAHIGGPHRVQITVEDTPEGERALAVRSWSLLAQVEDFDAEELPAQYLSPKITGLNFRFQDPEEEEVEDEIVWTDEWKETNRIARTVEVTLYLEPLEFGGDPVVLQRVVAIPSAPLAWGGGIRSGGREQPPGVGGDPSVTPAPATPGVPGRPPSTPGATPPRPPGTVRPPEGSGPSAPGAPPGMPPGMPPSMPPGMGAPPGRPPSGGPP